MDQGVDRPAAPARRQRHRHPRPDRAARRSRPSSTTADDVFAAVERVATDELAKAVTIAGKAERNAATDAVAARAIAELAGTSDAPGEFAGREKEIKEAVRSLTKKLVRKRIVDEGMRIDGRGLDRPAPRVGRGRRAADGARLRPVPAWRDPGARTSCTLAMPRMNQLSTRSTRRRTKRFLHHYNMPPWANGETGRVGSPKRREIGHGALAGRAILPVVPNQEEFAYTLRLVSEVLSSNGSTSMGSVCASQPVADGRRRADQGAGRRHRHGPRLRRRQVHDADRHPRCRGRVRRHGLQGRRHRRRDHRPAARHEDRRHPRRRADRRARAGQGGPPRRSST